MRGFWTFLWIPSARALLLTLSADYAMPDGPAVPAGALPGAWATEAYVEACDQWALHTPRGRPDPTPATRVDRPQDEVSPLP